MYQMHELSHLGLQMSPSTKCYSLKCKYILILLSEFIICDFLCELVFMLIYKKKSLDKKKMFTDFILLYPLVNIYHSVFSALFCAIS